MTKSKIVIGIVLLALIGFNVWTFFRLRTIVKVDNTQSSHIVSQNAAWTVFIKSLPEADQKAFLDTVDKILKEQK